MLATLLQLLDSSIFFTIARVFKFYKNETLHVSQLFYLIFMDVSISPLKILTWKKLNFIH